MAGKLRTKIVWIILIILLIQVSPSASALAASPIEKHILIINAYTPDYPTDELKTQGFKGTLEQATEFKFSYSYEYLNIARFSRDPDYYKTEAEYLKTKYKDHKPDFVFCDVNMYDIFEQDEDLFHGVPVIMDWNTDKQSLKVLDSNFCVIEKTIKIDENIQLMLNNNPLINKIYVVIGDSLGEQKLLRNISDSFTKYSNQVEFVFMNKLPYEQMLDSIRVADGNSAILMLQWFSDIKGKSFVGAQVAQAVCGVAKVPVYTTVVQNVGIGTIGGFVTDIGIVGQTAANTVLSISAGRNITDYSIIPCAPYRYVFDWRQLKKWKIDENKLPEGSTIQYREVTIWAQYRNYIIGVILLLVLQSGLILVLLVNKRKRKKAEEDLLQVNTSLEEMAKKLISFDKVKDEFLVNTSHELQTPLNGIINISQTLIEGNYGSINHRQKEELQLVLAVSKRLSSLINDIIDLEKIKRNEMQFNIDTYDIKVTISVVVDVFKDLIQSKDIDILVNIPEGISPVLADENRLGQVLYNLIGNAVKFTQRGNITLSAEEHGDYVKIMIEDTGIGIQKGEQDKLFKAFTQADADISKQYGGSGLGLYVSRQLLERMGGEISLEWSEPDRGTCFCLKLPKSDEIYINTDVIPDTKQETTVVELSQNELCPGYKILAVDDESTNLRVLKSILNSDGYNVITATSGAEAINMLKNQRNVDLVLMDVMMPKMSGLEACRKIREEYSLHELPLLILTVRNTPDDIVAGFEAGANDFVIKPIVAKELRARVATLLLMKRSVNESIKNEIAFLQAQIKPHFLHNAMCTIISFCYTDGEKAAELLGNLNEYLQKSFNIDNTVGTVSLEHELELTKAYLEIEKARFQERLTVEYDVDQELLKVEIPPLTIQPLVENGIRHGLMVRQRGGIVKISAHKDIDGITISVEDNGIGIKNPESLFKRNERLEGRRRGVGLSNIKKRLMAYYGAELYLYTEINKNTKVYFTIPFEEEM